MTKTIAIYPGTFDPITKGHLDIIKRSSMIFKKVIVAVAKQNYKTCLFTLKERVQLIRGAVKGIKNVEIETYDGLTVDFARKKGSRVIIRGLRTVSDFEYELSLAFANKAINKNIEFVFLATNKEYSFISSSMIKGIAEAGGDILKFVPENVFKAIKKKIKTLKNLST